VNEKENEGEESNQKEKYLSREVTGLDWGGDQALNTTRQEQKRS